MRRLLGIIVLGLALPALLVFGVAADDGAEGGGYKVRAVFDNVASAVPGEDVKVAGAKVGVIESMDVTKSKKAIVVMRIEDARFRPFRANARCTVRPQSLIGEKFVECNPGTDAAPALARIDDGAGTGQHLLPLSRTSSPVDIDLINNIMRRPYRERLAILLSEFGTGLAGRGKELNQVIHRANPALRETDRVLNTLARQNRVLARLAEQSDRSLAPLARDRKRLTGFIRTAGETGAATAERRADIERGLRLLPGFLGELRPTMADLGGFADQARPVMANLNRSGDDVSRMIQALGPFSRAAQPSVTSLGDAFERGRPAVLRTRPLIRDLGSFGRSARPLAGDLDRLTASIDKTGGIERLMELTYFGALATNGYDDISHYLRANLVINLCSRYQLVPDAGCTANFQKPADDASASTAKAALADEPATGDRGQGSVSGQGGLLGALMDRKGQHPEGKKAIERIQRDAQRPSPALRGKKEPALDYLLGSDG